MQITYIFDPLCGWCYGAGPAIEQLARLEGVSLALAPSGLFFDPRPLDRQFAAHIWQYDQRIAAMTGVTVSEAYREKILGQPSMIDSKAATLAIIAAGQGDTATELSVLKALQLARYGEGRDNTDPATVAAVLEETGFAEAAREIRTPSEDLLIKVRQRVEAARMLMRQFGLSGVPAVVIDGRRVIPNDALYGPFERLREKISQ